MEIHFVVLSNLISTCSMLRYVYDSIAVQPWPSRPCGHSQYFKLLLVRAVCQRPFFFSFLNRLEDNRRVSQLRAVALDLNSLCSHCIGTFLFGQKG